MQNALFTSRRRLLQAGSALALGASLSPAVLAQKTRELRYGHMNPPNSAAGMQAQWLAELVDKHTGGQIRIRVYPSSQLGKMQEMAEATSMGTIAISHNTAGGTGSLYEPFAALDTPYLYRDVEHLLNVTDVDSPVMKTLNEGLIGAAGVRVLYTYYFGTRQLTANKAVRQPSDLAGVKIRALPFPISMAAVEGLGAVPVPVDWSEVPTALATGQVAGQENPVNTVLSSKLYESQSHLMLTGHIMNPHVIVINEDLWQGFKPEQRDAIARAAQEVRKRASAMVQQQEADELEQLRKLKMTVIGPGDGLQLDAFKASVKKIVDERFTDKFGKLYQQIAAVR